MPEGSPPQGYSSATLALTLRLTPKRTGTASRSRCLVVLGLQHNLHHGRTVAELREKIAADEI